MANEMRSMLKIDRFKFSTSNCVAKQEQIAKYLEDISCGRMRGKESFVEIVPGPMRRARNGELHVH